AAIVERFRVVGQDRQCFLIARDRLLAAAELVENDAAIVERDRMAGHNRQRLAKARECLFAAAELVVDEAEVRPRLRVSTLRFHDRAYQVERLGVAALPESYEPHQMPRIAMARIFSQNLQTKTLSVRELTSGMEGEGLGERMGWAERRLLDA